MASIVEFVNKQGRKRWRVHVLVDGTMRHPEFRAFEEACQHLYVAEMHHLNSQNDSQYTKRRDFTVGKAIQFYLGSQWEKVGQKRLAENTFRKAENALVRLPVQFLAVRVGDVTAQLVTTHVPSPALIWLRAAFNLFNQHDLLNRNPCPRPEKRQKKKPVIPLRDEVQRVYNAAGHPTLKMFIFLCSVCGLRASEALAVRRSDIRGDRLYVKRHLTRHGLVEGTKRNDGRVLKLPGSINRVLSTIDPEADFLVHHEKDVNKHVNMSTFLDRRMRPLYRAAGVRFSNHGLRHFAAANWIAEGRDLLKVQRLLGHSSVQITEAHYGHLFGEPDAVKSYLDL